METITVTHNACSAIAGCCSSPSAPMLRWLLYLPEVELYLPEVELELYLPEVAVVFA